MAKLNANGLQIEYDEFGSRDNPAVLLIMGLGTQMIAWSAEFCAGLAAGGYRVIRFDNRDVGLSQWLNGRKAPSASRLLLKHWLGVPSGAPYRLGDMARDASAVLDGLGVDRAHIVGASMGGMIAQLIAVNEPERAQSLTTIMSSTGNRRLPQARADVRKLLLRDRAPSHDRTAYIDSAVQFFQTIGSPAFPRSDAQWRELMGTAYDRGVNPAGFFRQLAAIIEDGDRRRRLRQVRTPTLVIHGDADPLVPLAHGQDLAAVIPGAQLSVIKGMGHDLPPQLVPGLVTLLHQHFAKAVA